MADIGWAALPITPTFKGLQQDLNRGTSKALTAAGTSGGAKFGDSASKSARSKFAGSAKSIVAPLVGAFAAIRVGDFLKDAVTGASDLAESTNKVEQVFGKGSGAVFKFSKDASKSLGQTNQQARDAAATFGIFGKAAKFTDKQNAKFSLRMTTLASDLASFSNTSPDEAIQALGSALRGEAEPIRAYGVLLDDATLKAEAMRLGILKPTKDKNKILSAQARVTAGQAKYNEEVKKHGKESLEAIKAEGSLGAAQSALQKATAGTIGPLTQQQKVIAAQSSVMRQTKLQQGDFARTSGGLANQQRILSARWTDAKAALGGALLPTVNKAVLFLNAKGIPAFEKFATFFETKGVPAIKKFADNAKPFITDVLEKMRDVLKDIEPFAGKVVDKFNALPDGVKKGLMIGGGLVALKKILGGGGGGGKNAGYAKQGIIGGVASATKGALIGKAGSLLADKLLEKFSKPLPVFVVNKGFGGGGGMKALGSGAAGAAGAAGIGAAGIFVGSVAALSVGAIAAAKFGASVEKSTGVDKFGSRGNPTETQLLTPKFREEGAELKKAAFYSGLARQNLSKLPGDLDKGFNGAQALKNQVFGVETSAKRTRTTVISLVEVLEAARQKAVKVEQAVSVARQSKVDAQLGGGFNVGVMNVHGTSLPEVRRDADHKRRARAYGAESFQ